MTVTFSLQTLKVKVALRNYCRRQLIEGERRFFAKEKSNRWNFGDEKKINSVSGK